MCALILFPFRKLSARWLILIGCLFIVFKSGWSAVDAFELLGRRNLAAAADPAQKAGKTPTEAQADARRAMEAQRKRPLGATRASTRNVATRPAQVPKTVGVWDLGAWVGGLPQIITLLNTAQNILLFFEAQAAIPSGITSGKQRVVQWSEAALERKGSPVPAIVVTVRSAATLRTLCWPASAM